jgi:hypothetical protein
MNANDDIPFTAMFLSDCLWLAQFHNPVQD